MRIWAGGDSYASSREWESSVVRRKIWSILSVTVTCLVATIVLADSASARPAICSRLERQLASGGSSNSGNFSRYARAAAAQGEQIQIARQQARNAGCGGGFFSIFGGNQAPRSCGRIMNTISRMEANRNALLRKRDGLSGGDFSGSRRAILASLAANNCSGSKVINVKANRQLPAPVQDASIGRASLFDQIFNDEPVRTVRKEKSTEKKIIQRVVNGNDSESSRNGNSVYVPMTAGGTVRTLCVRTCDGFYFPVSFSTTSDHFAKDEAACSAMCPGAETKLYYHSVPDQEPEQMVDLQGNAYMSTPSAFKYRINGAHSTPGCACQAAAQIPQSEPVSDESELANVKPDKNAKKWIAVPQSRPDQFMDSETIANLRGGLTSEKLADFLGKPDGTSATASLETSKIRIVGPAFLPARTGAAGLQAAAPTDVQ